MEHPAPATVQAPKISRRQRRIQAAAIGTEPGPVAEAGTRRRDMRKKRLEAAIAVSKSPPKATALSAPPELGRRGTRGSRGTRGTRGTDYKIQPLPKNITELPEDMNTKIQLKAAKNEIMMMTNENLQEFRRIIIQCSTLESMTDPTKLRKAKGNKNGSPKLKQCVLARIFKKLTAIKLVDLRIDIETIRVLEFALTHSKIKTILLSNISFDSDVICERFANLFDETRNVDSIVCLILRGIDFIVVDTETGSRFNIFINKLANLKNLEELEFSNFNIIKMFITDMKDVTFDYIFVKLLIKLKKLGALIFTNNVIDEYEYEYIFNEYYDERQHCYVIKIMDTVNKKLLNGVYVKCNRVTEGGYDDDGDKESDEYYMDLIYINTTVRNVNILYYYSKGNKTTLGSRTVLREYINTDFEYDRRDLIKSLTEKIDNGKGNKEDYKDFLL
jgi:hypothetical protein